MLAYLFWHRPPRRTPAYEAALDRFHRALADRPPTGFVGSRFAAIDDRQWLPGGGFEDWYLVEDFTALGTLNAAAVDPAHVETHDRVAQLSGTGAGGLYRLVDGDWRASGPSTWSADPFPAGAGTRWQRLMVLGPAPEHCLVRVI